MRESHETLMRQSEDALINGADLTDPLVQEIFDDVIAKRISRAEAIESLQSLEISKADRKQKLERLAGGRTLSQPVDRLMKNWPTIQNIRAGVMQERDADFRIDSADYDITPARLLERMAKECDRGLYNKLQSGEAHHGPVMWKLFRDWSEGNTNNQLVAEFPAAIEDSITMAVNNGYESVREPLADLLINHCTRPVQNFRDVTIFNQSEMPELATVAENGEYQHADLAGEAGNTGAVTTKGVVMNVTRQAIVNMDLMLPLVTAEKAGKAAKQAISDSAITVLTDAGAALFTGGQGNLAAAAGAPSVATWEAICQAMGEFTGPNGQVLNIHPAVMLTGCTYETTAAILRNAAFNPTPGPLLPDYNAGSFEVISDARITGNEWYALADPRQVRVLELLYLQGGRPAPVVEFFNGFEYDAVAARIRIDYGVCFSDWRGAYKTPAV